MRTWIPAGTMFLVTGVLELILCAFAVVGTITGGALTVVSLTGELERELAFLGPLLLVFYPLWFLCTAVAGPVHVLAGASCLAGRRNRKLLWAATVLSVLPIPTVYCAPTSVIAGALGLVTALTPEPPRIEM